MKKRTAVPQHGSVVREVEEPAASVDGHPALDLQRRAGNAAAATVLQTKLSVGKADDPAEREADRVAADVVRRLSGTVGEAAAPAGKVRRSSSGADALGGQLVTPDVEAGIAGSSGRAMAPGTLSRMESAFGADLSGVRIHDGSTADTLSRSLQAEAFTTGNDVFFRKGNYDPGTSGGQELLAHELTHVVQQSGGTASRRIRRFVDVKTFATRTTESRFTQKSTAQKTIEKLLTTYNGLGVANDKGKVVIPDAKLAQGIDLLESMKNAADLWISAHTVEVEDTTGVTPPAPGQAPPEPKTKTLVDPKRQNRAAGMAWFAMAAGSELASMIQRRDSDALAGTTQDEVVVDTLGRQKLKEHYTGNLSGALTKAAWLLNKVVPDEGDSTEFSLDVKIPVHEGVFVGGTLDLSAEKDGSVEVGCEARFQAGGTAGVASVAGALGGYIKASAKTPEQVMKLLSYGFYRRCVESNLPAEVSSLVWGGGASDYAKAKADQWSRGIETEIFGAGVDGADDAFVEMGASAAVKAEAGIGAAGKISGELAAQLGTRYDQTSLQNRKGGAGAKNQKSSGFFTQNLADKFGRGAEKSAGRTSTNVSLSGELSFLDGALSGSAALEMALRSQGLHAAERKGAQGALNNIKMEELSFSISAAGLLPLGGLATKVAALGLDLASYGRKKYLASLQQAESKPGVPVTEILLAKQAGEVAFEGMAGLPFTDWAKSAVGFGADAGAEAGKAALDVGSKVGIELGVTLEKGSAGLEAKVELKHVKSMSVELPSILEMELVRKSRLGIAKYAGGAWTVSL